MVLGQIFMIESDFTIEFRTPPPSILCSATDVMTAFLCDVILLRVVFYYHFLSSASALMQLCNPIASTPTCSIPGCQRKNFQRHFGKICKVVSSILLPEGGKMNKCSGILLPFSFSWLQLYLTCMNTRFWKEEGIKKAWESSPPPNNGLHSFGTIIIALATNIYIQAIYNFLSSWPAQCSEDIESTWCPQIWRGWVWIEGTNCPFNQEKNTKVAILHFTVMWSLQC